MGVSVNNWNGFRNTQIYPVLDPPAKEEEKKPFGRLPLVNCNYYHYYYFYYSFFRW